MVLRLIEKIHKPKIKNVCRIKLYDFWGRKIKMNTVCFNAEKFYRIACDYFHYESNVKQAKKYVNLALKNAPYHLKSLILKGEIFLSEKKTKSALNIFKKALKISPNDTFCILWLAKTYNALQKQDISLHYLDKILAQNILDKEFLSECYKLKINILINLNQYKKAENILKTLNYSLYSNDIFHLEENFYKTLQNKKSPETKEQRRILHVNF